VISTSSSAVGTPSSYSRTRVSTVKPAGARRLSMSFTRFSRAVPASLTTRTLGGAGQDARPPPCCLALRGDRFGRLGRILLVAPDEMPVAKQPLVRRPGLNELLLPHQRVVAVDPRHPVVGVAAAELLIDGVHEAPKSVREPLQLLLELRDARPQLRGVRHHAATFLRG